MKLFVSTASACDIREIVFPWIKYHLTYCDNISRERDIEAHMPASCAHYLPTSRRPGDINLPLTFPGSSGDDKWRHLLHVRSQRARPIMSRKQHEELVSPPRGSAGSNGGAIYTRVEDRPRQSASDCTAFYITRYTTHCTSPCTALHRSSPSSVAGTSFQRCTTILCTIGACHDRLTWRWRELLSSLAPLLLTAAECWRDGMNCLHFEWVGYFS